MDWHRLETTEALQRLGVEPDRGLSGEEAARRLAEHGPNELLAAQGISPWTILLE